MLSRSELRLATDRPVIATGHQTLLWHPGILAKYLVTDAFAQAHDVATANLVVDQHVGEFGAFEIPVRKPDGSLGVRKLELCKCRPDVPMGRHAAFTPPQLPDELIRSAAIPSVAEGVRNIFVAAQAHRDAPNAALQMAAAIADLMDAHSNQALARAMTDITATALVNTSLARAIMQRMIDDPQRCAACYNRAVAAVPEAGIGPLMIRDDYVELPVWRIGEDGRRMRGYDSDVERVLEATSDESAVNGHDARHSSFVIRHSLDLLPRALFMTALVRLGMCDLFIHGTGGAAYDQAMEVWIKDWLDIDVGSIAIVSATLLLPLMAQGEQRLDVDVERQGARRLWHDPEPNGSSSPNAIKRTMLAEIDRLPRNSPQRKAAFLAMHERMQQMRGERRSFIDDAQQRVERAKRQAADWRIAQRRDWAFALYPREMLEELASEARRAVRAPALMK
jgi:hypothetical protein